jgi:hypothetical protein
MRPFQIDTVRARHLARDLHSNAQGENPPHPELPEAPAFTAFNEAVHAALDNIGARMTMLRRDMGHIAQSSFQMSREAEDSDAALRDLLGAAM